MEAFAILFLLTNRNHAKTTLLLVNDSYQSQIVVSNKFQWKGSKARLFILHYTVHSLRQCHKMDHEGIPFVCLELYSKDNLDWCNHKLYKHHHEQSLTPTDLKTQSSTFCLIDTYMTNCIVVPTVESSWRNILCIFLESMDVWRQVVHEGMMCSYLWNSQTRHNYLLTHSYACKTLIHQHYPWHVQLM